MNIVDRDYQSFKENRYLDKVRIWDLKTIPCIHFSGIFFNKKSNKCEIIDVRSMQCPDGKIPNSDRIYWNEHYDYINVEYYTSDEMLNMTEEQYNLIIDKLHKKAIAINIQNICTEDI